MRSIKAQPDELYHRLVHMHGAEFQLLMHAFSSKESGGTGKHEPMCMALRYGKGRVFHTPLGHVWRKVAATRSSVQTPGFKLLISRGTEWAATGHCTIPPSAFGLERIEPNTLPADEKDQGWELLFDGKTSNGWRRYRQKDFPIRG